MMRTKTIVRARAICCLLIALVSSWAVWITVSAVQPAHPVWVVDSLTRVQPTDPPGSLTSASLKAARNESEAVQVVIRAPAGAALTEVNVTVSDLIGPGTIPKSQIARYRAHYVPVTQPSNWPKQGWFSPHPPGEWPDALVPSTVPGGVYPSFPFTVAAGRNQPVWVEVSVPKGTPAGTYTGTVTVTADGLAPVTIPLTLTVWGFTLPDRPTLASEFGLYDTWFLRASQHSAGSDPRTLNANLRAALAEHRLGIETIDGRGYFDEPSTPAAYNAIRAAAPGLRAQGIPVVVTIQNPDAWTILEGAVDVWVPVFYECKYRAWQIPAKLATGKQVWSYAAGISPNDVPSWLLDYDLIHFRIPAWLNYRHGQTGLLFWTTAYWQTGDPWTNTSTDSDGANLGGTLFYPGDKVGAPNAAIPSARLKAIRDGLEDYDYLALLASLGDPGFAASLAATLAPAWDNWNHDPGALASAREQAALRILQLGGI